MRKKFIPDSKKFKQIDVHGCSLFAITSHGDTRDEIPYFLEIKDIVKYLLTMAGLGNKNKRSI